MIGILCGCVEREGINKEPIASFIYIPTENIYVNDLITFKDSSTDEDGKIVKWSWNFGDGTRSKVQNPSHSYKTVGKYTIKLKVTDDDGSDSDPYISDILVSYTPPFAAFITDPDPLVNITTSTQITFTDVSKPGDANITTHLWDFGDGNTSNLTVVKHTYAMVGIYTVTLTVTDENGETDTTEKITIEVE